MHQRKTVNLPLNSHIMLSSCKSYESIERWRWRAVEGYLTFTAHTPSSLPLKCIPLISLSLCGPALSPPPQTSTRKWIKVRTAKQKQKINLLLPRINYEISLSGGEKNSIRWVVPESPQRESHCEAGTPSHCHVISICALFISGNIPVLLRSFITVLISWWSKCACFFSSFHLKAVWCFCRAPFLLL